MRSLSIVVLALSSVLTAAVARADGVPVDISGDSVTCNTITGTVKLKPAYIFGAQSPSVRKIKGVLDGCVDNTNPNVLISASKFSGTLTAATNDCADLLQAATVTGALTTKWKTNVLVSPSTTTVTVTSTTGGITTLYPPFTAGVDYPWSAVVGTVAGAFTGGDHGMQSTDAILASQDFVLFQTACNAQGLKELDFGTGQLTLK